ncbi:MAG: GPR endopeptidase [Oscillospiraceae bacterium]
MYFRTDLALELAENLTDNISGIKTSAIKAGSLVVNIVEIINPDAAKRIGKPVGKYITIETPPLSDHVQHSENDISAAAAHLASLLPDHGLVLVVGLGNTEITPDALGPQTARQILATRHITGELARAAGLDNLRGVAVLAPGVMGQTGIETGEIISTLVKQISPAAVIAIDALAAHSASRLGCTIQFSNTGISPGAGVFNKRQELSQETLGVPVIAVGIPTIVDAATLASDLMAGDEEQNRSLFEPRGEKMIVTPREIDLVIQRGSKFLSLVINAALQPTISIEDIAYLMA